MGARHADHVELAGGDGVARRRQILDARGNVEISTANVEKTLAQLMELRVPLGIAIVGGLLVSQLLTLYTTPVIYIFFDNLARRFAEWRARRHHAAPAPGTSP